MSADPTAPRVVGGGANEPNPQVRHMAYETAPAVLPEEGTTPEGWQPCVGCKKLIDAEYVAAHGWWCVECSHLQPASSGESGAPTEEERKRIEAFIAACRLGSEALSDGFGKMHPKFRSGGASTLSALRFWLEDYLASRLARSPRAAGEPSEEERLTADSLAICQQRGWSTHWTARGAYLHLEASELIEAVRGKGTSTPTEEAGDVLLVLMSILAANEIPWKGVVASARAKVEAFRTKPRYAGEEFDPAAPPPERAP